jgi:hypothetical protein
MPAKDRRSGVERRASIRYPVDVEVEWEGSAGRRPGAMSDVSLDGCFVLCSGDVSDGERVQIFVPLADAMKVQFDATVVNHVFDIGIGVRFEKLSGPQRDLLINIVRNSGVS